ncbi:MAG TPA: LuxR C-terminal-related transcriptional regulator [Pseudonocardia sp.]|nr:LuxR C-terminal-related transcriptional regulator [Pseudonocardia sp.]
MSDAGGIGEDLPPDTRPQDPQLVDSAENSRVNSLIDELIERQQEFGDVLLMSVAKGTPRRYRPWLVEDYAAPYMRTYLPIALQCMRHGTPPDPAVLQPIRESSAVHARNGVPLLVLLSMVRAAIGAFAGYVVKQAGPRRLPAAIVVLGRVAVVSHDLAHAAVDGYTGDSSNAASPRRPQVTLGPTPMRILRLAALGHSTKEIARALHYSEQAVTYHLGQMMKQFGVPNRTALIARAVQQGAIELPDPASPAEDAGEGDDLRAGDDRRGA